MKKTDWPAGALFRAAELIIKRHSRLEEQRVEDVAAPAKWGKPRIGIVTGTGRIRCFSQIERKCAHFGRMKSGAD